MWINTQKVFKSMGLNSLTFKWHSQSLFLFLIKQSLLCRHVSSNLEIALKLLNFKINKDHWTFKTGLKKVWTFVFAFLLKQDTTNNFKNRLTSFFDRQTKPICLNFPSKDSDQLDYAYNFTHYASYERLQKLKKFEIFV